MKMQMFTIHDSKGEIFNPPYSSRSFGEAERIFSELQKNPESTISKYPEDFSLHHIGEYDDQTGEIAPLIRKMIMAAKAP